MQDVRPHPMVTAGDVIKFPAYGMAVLTILSEHHDFAIDQLSGIRADDRQAVAQFLRDLADALTAPTQGVAVERESASALDR